MAILAIFHAPDINIDNYEKLRREVDWETRQPPGAMFHAAAFDEKGHLRVTDVWASAGEMEQFLQLRLQPALEKLGLSIPEFEVFPVHNLNAYPTLDKHLLSR